MWRISDLKLRGKDAFMRNYWKCVLISFILAFVLGGSTLSGHFSVDVSEWWDEMTYSVSSIFSNLGYYMHNWNWAPFALIAALFGMAAGVVGLIIRVFVLAPLEVGGCRFFLENAYEPAGIDRIGFVFSNGNYLKTVGTLFLRSLFIFLWSLLLVVPGIVKAYEYRMVPYLLADSPQLTTQEAFQISKDLMYGQKMNAFVLDLSFIGWYILTGITCGLLAIFYVNPYQHATNAELFLELKRQYFNPNQGYPY